MPRPGRRVPSPRTVCATARFLKGWCRRATPSRRTWQWDRANSSIQRRSGASCSTLPRSMSARPPRKAEPWPNAIFGSSAPGEGRRNDRGPFSNPFLDIGLDHGANRWEERCREIFRQCEGDARAQSKLNMAEERIRGALHGTSGWDVFYQLPLDQFRYALPSQVPQHLVPPVEAMARRTPVTSGSELETIRARAAVELLDDFRTTAPRLDRHSTTR